MSDLISVQNRLDQHEREIALIGQSTRQMIDGQKQLTESLTDLTISLNKYIERHERSATDITDIKTEQKAHTAQIAAIRAVWAFCSVLISVMSVAGTIPINHRITKVP